MTLIPLNGHVQIEPIEQDSFISSSKTAYEEIGKVISVALEVNWVGDATVPPRLPLGVKVFFDSWMATKYPDGKQGFYWLVPYSAIRAYEPIPTE